MKNETAALLGRRIRALRKSKGLTQEELGAECGINYKYVGAIERGEENPSLSILLRVSKGLGVEILELFRFSHEQRDPAKLKKELIDTINQIGKDEREKLQLILKLVNVLR
jgi:transcriptional regulator with XRE-family HTH domain